MTQPLPGGRPPARRQRWRIALALLVVVLLGGTGTVVYRSMTNPAGDGARAAAVVYLTALERGDSATAYATWCASDRSAYPQAEFRAQHEWRQGRAVQVTGVRTAPFGDVSTAAVSYRLAGEGAMHPLSMQRTAGRWELCPHGAQLQRDMQNCGCMTTTQKLEADIARVMDGDHDLVQVSCPPQTALVDGVPITCTGSDAAGRRWRLVATESGGATYTRVTVSPASSRS